MNNDIRNVIRKSALAGAALCLFCAAAPCMAASMPGSAHTTKHAAQEAGKITVKFNGDGYDYEYDGVKYPSAKELGGHLDKRKKYRLFFYNLSTDEMMLERVTDMEAAGISINSVECCNNRNANTQVISVRKLKKTAQ